MSTTELQAPSPRGLGRFRRSKGGANKSSTSLISESSTNNDNSESTGLKASIDNVIDKVRKSVDERRESAGDDSPHRKLSIFKRKKKGDEDGSSRRQSKQVDELALQTTHSNASALDASSRDSLLTDDVSDTDG